MWGHLEQREIFHLAFMREFARRVKPGTYAIKGGCALRFFYRSIRYSEDMDIDIARIEVHRLKDLAMGILESGSLTSALAAYQIERIVPPSLKSAKQTETVQRFKTHLITSAGLDLFTKIEFSRRGLEGSIVTTPVSGSILIPYKQPPLILSHYPIEHALRQKILALAGRAAPQARDAFDIYTLSSQIKTESLKKSLEIPKAKLKAAEDTLFSLSFENYRDTVCSYLGEGDAQSRSSAQMWEDIQLAVAGILRGTK